MTAISVQAYGSAGGRGGGSPGKSGMGGFANGTLAVTPGQVLQLEIGNHCNYNGHYTQSCGYNEGGNGNNYQGGGGGASDIRVSPYGLQNRVVVAGGGGGAGDDGANGGKGEAI